MPSDDVRTRLVNLVLSAAKYVCENLEREITNRKCDDVHRCQWLPSHRIHVRQRIRCSDLSEVVWIVDYGREEVDRLDERNLVRQQVHSRIVERFPSYQKTRIARRWKWR